jgi:putative PIG3 family NAD(P)H quinone oxidoreductase
MSSVPAEMAVVEIAAVGGPEQLRPARRPVPKPAAGEVLLRVAAAGVNRPDVLQRLGRHPPPPGASDLPGLEVAGEIVALGPDCGDLAVGEPVTALLAGGGYAAYALAAAPLCLPLPSGLSMIEAAAIPETFFTVWSNVFERGRCRPGETLLVHGGTSGIGTVAIQLGAALGSRVFATAGTPDKARACERLGAARGIDYRTEDFVEVVRSATGGEGADVILDMVGGAYVGRNLQVAAVEGRIVNIAFLAGMRAEVDLSVIMRKRLVLTGSTLRSRPLADKAAIADALRRNVWPLLASGRVRPVIHATFPLAEAAAAQRLMESSAHIGKIVLTL